MQVHIYWTHCLIGQETGKQARSISFNHSLYQLSSQIREQNIQDDKGYDNKDSFENKYSAAINTEFNTVSSVCLRYITCLPCFDQQQSNNKNINKKLPWTQFT